MLRLQSVRLTLICKHGLTVYPLACLLTAERPQLTQKNLPIYAIWVCEAHFSVPRGEKILLVD